jgi:hypothetical protein
MVKGRRGEGFSFLFKFSRLPNLLALDDETDRMARLNRQMHTGVENDQGADSASTISQKWEQDARKDPEEEYFRLVSSIY